jgi:hypothetical protein
MIVEESMASWPVPERKKNSPGYVVMQAGDGGEQLGPGS